MHHFARGCVSQRCARSQSDELSLNIRRGAAVLYMPSPWRQLSVLALLQSSCCARSVWVHRGLADSSVATHACLWSSVAAAFAPGSGVARLVRSLMVVLRSLRRAHIRFRPAHVLPMSTVTRNSATLPSARHSCDKVSDRTCTARLGSQRKWRSQRSNGMSVQGGPPACLTCTHAFALVSLVG